ncbi:hypothetical protein [Pedobacter aquatilis]|uniref:hypothetical protein n=1 Tax=Pedobacter aquatilis TaxID=351343 RepID=UPI00292CCEF3|nr:hypothetical protein [Pedobacter aquatilis]
MKILLKSFFLFHFTIMIVSCSIGTITAYFGFHNKHLPKKGEVKLDFNNILLNNPIVDNYTIFSGTNTGYGFYGVNVATEKIFMVDLFDQTGKKISTVTTFGLNKASSIQRFNVLPSVLFNLISENKTVYKKQVDSAEQKKVLVLEKYINKMFKHVGLYSARANKDCKSYSVKLCALGLNDIWAKENYSNSKSILVYEEIIFDK